MDELLKGGLYSGQLCELCGPSSSGKTQLCLTIAANVAIRSDITVWYLDTKRDFSRLRYEEILKARNCRQEVITLDVEQNFDDALIELIIRSDSNTNSNWSLNVKKSIICQYN